MLFWLLGEFHKLKAVTSKQSVSVKKKKNPTEQFLANIGCFISLEILGVCCKESVPR